MYTLYYAPGAASLVVHWLLLELDVPFDARKVDTAAGAHKSADYLRMNPNGLVPTLVLDGAPMFEAAAMVLHLADVHPAAQLAPALGTLPRAHYYQWILHCANTLQPAFRHWFYPNEAAGEANSANAQASACGRIEATWQRIDAHLAQSGPYLLGETLSAADFMLCMLMRWSRNMPKPATDWPALRAHAELLKARPSFKALYAREGLTEWA